MDRNIFKFIWRHSRRQQAVVTLTTLASLPFYYYSLDLPKTIVNEALSGENIPGDILGVPIDQYGYLFVLSGVFLALVLINGGFKYFINVYKGLIGERMVRRLRYELYARVLRFRPPQFRRMSQGEIIPMVTSEVESLGGFVGEAFATPIQQGGQLLVSLFFIFIQNPILGAAAIALYPVQGYVIARLRRRVLELGKMRVRAVRRLGDRVGETVSGVSELHANGAANFHLSDVANRLGDIFDIRYEIYRRKYFIKFLNNFINQLTPFFFYSIGGYLVINGDLTIGALVAVLGAYKDLAAPWKELLDYYQLFQDVGVKFEQIVEQFDPSEMASPNRLMIPDSAALEVPPAVALVNVSYADDGDVALENVTLDVPTDRHVAVVGPGGGGRDVLVMILARLLSATSGSIRWGDISYDDIPEPLLGRYVAYVGPQSYIFTETLRANLYYGLKQRPQADFGYDEAGAMQRRRRVREAHASANTPYDINADWVDYEEAGTDGPAGLEAKALDVLRAVGLDEDVYRMGLGGAFDPAQRPDAVEKVMQARRVVRRLFDEGRLVDVVEPFDADRYNSSATVAENLLFGTPVGETFATEQLAENDYVQEVLEKVGLTQAFLEVGAKVAETMIELFAGLPPGHEFFDQFSFISSDQLPAFQPILAKVAKDGYASLKAPDRARLMALPFKIIISRHRLGLIDEAMQERLVAARKAFAEGLPPEYAGSVEFFDAGRYNKALTIQDNILFGKIRYGQSGTLDKVQALMAEVVQELDLRDTVIGVGLDHPVGVAGSRLSGSQRQKLGIARALLKQPRILILQEATAGLDGPTQAMLHAEIRRRQQGRGIIWAVHRPSLARDFEQVICVRGGRVVGVGTPADLDAEGAVLREMIQAE